MAPELGIKCDVCHAIVSEAKITYTCKDCDNTRADSWIPVSERLPEVGIRMGEYITPTVIHLNNGDYFIGYFDGVYWRVGSLTYILQSDVTHWMPLPALPKEVEG